MREKWLQGESLERCEIALEMNETFPFDSINEMINVFEALVSKWPQLRGHCDSIIGNRREQGV